MEKDFQSFSDFWPFYLSQHSKKSTRIWHFIGTSFVFICIIVAVIFQSYWILLLAPVIAYGMAWISHFFIEGNKPATFGHPFWSLASDFKMFWYILSGKMADELKRVEIDIKDAS